MPADSISSTSSRAESNGAVRASGLGKKYKIYPSPWDRLAEWAQLGRVKRHEDFWALRGVEFSIAPGASLGVIGINGSGKSTLLKILTGAAHATEGTAHVSGRVLSLLELGTGMNPDLTGRQNVINSSRLLAFPPGYAQEKMETIQAFAELEDFFDRPVRFYSSGMTVRLAFSMFVAFDPDVFIVDEALSVGDVFFQQKCARRLRELRERGTTLLLVSHDMGAIESLCDQTLVLHHGRQEYFGEKLSGIRIFYALSGATAKGTSSPAFEPGDQPVINSAVHVGGASVETGDQPALAELDDAMLAKLPWISPDLTGNMGEGQIEIEAICLQRQDGQPAAVVEPGQDVDIYLRLRATCDVWPMNCGITLFDRFQTVVFAQGWLNMQLQPLRLKRGQIAYAAFRVRMDLEPREEYVLNVEVSEALPQAASPSGWDQNYGGTRYVSLPRVARIAVNPRDDGARWWFGPANLRTNHRRKIADQ